MRKQRSKQLSQITSACLVTFNTCQGVLEGERRTLLAPIALVDCDARSLAVHLPTSAHPFIEIARGEHLFGVFPDLVPYHRGDVPEVTQLHRGLAPRHALGEIIHRFAVAEHGRNPFILEAVG